MDIKVFIAQILLFPKILNIFQLLFWRCRRRIYQNRIVNRFNRAQCDDAGYYSYVVIGRQNKFFLEKKIMRTRILQLNTRKRRSQASENGVDLKPYRNLIEKLSLP